MEELFNKDDNETSVNLTTHLQQPHFIFAK